MSYGAFVTRPNIVLWKQTEQSVEEEAQQHWAVLGDGWYDVYGTTIETENCNKLHGVKFFFWINLGKPQDRKA